MRRLFQCALLVCLTLLTVVGAYAASGNEQRSKARYYYLEGARMQAMNRIPEAYEYYKKAYLTDPGYAEAASNYGMMRLVLPTDTLQTKTEQKRSLALIRDYVDKYPADISEARTYALLSGRIDTISETIRVFERLDTLRPDLSMTLLQLADAYVAANENEKALNALGRFEKIEGKSPQLSMKKMSVMIMRGDTVGARQEAEDLIASNPRDPYFHILKGNLYEVIGDNDSVYAAYSKAEELNPDNGTAKLSLATYYKNIGDSVNYDRKVYEALLSEDFEMEDKLGLLSEYLQTLLEDKSDTSRGDHLFEVIMEQYPHETAVLDLAARYSGAKGDYEEAIRHIDYAIDLDSGNERYWQQLMSYEIAADDGEGAMETFERAGEHINLDDQFKMMYVTAASMAKRYDEAERAVGELIHEYSDALPVGEAITDDAPLRSLSYDAVSRLSSYYSMLGDMYYNSGALEKAYTAYDNSLMLNPSNPLSLNNYAYFLSEHNGDLDRAEKMARQAVELAPDNETYLDTMAWVLFKKREYKEALEFQERAIEMAREHGTEVEAEFYNHLGDILFMNHEPERALEEWTRALEMEPDNALLKKKVTHKTFFFE